MNKKTIKEIAIEHAKRSGHGYTIDPDFKPHRWVLSAMQEYAVQCCNEQIKLCAEQATASIDYVDFHDFSKGIEGCHVDQYSILEITNIATIE